MPAMVLGRPLSLSGYFFRDQPLPEVLRLVRQQLDIASIGLWPHLLAGRSTADVRTQLADAGVAAYCLNVPGDHRLNSPGHEEPARQTLAVALDQAAELGVPLVQIYAGTDPERDADENLARFAEGLAPWLDAAAARDLTVAVENNLDVRREDPRGVNPSRRPERLRALAERLAHPCFGLVYDPGNFYAVGVDPFPAAYDLLAPWIVSVEFKDLLPYDAARHGPPDTQHLLTDSHTGSFLPVPAGQGAVGMAHLLKRLAADDYQGVLALDPYATGAKLLGDCRASLPLFTAYQAPSRLAPTV